MRHAVLVLSPTGGRTLVHDGAGMQWMQRLRWTTWCTEDSAEKAEATAAELRDPRPERADDTRVLPAGSPEAAALDGSEVLRA